METTQKLESKAMKTAFFILSFMAILGITVYNISGSVAILIDGIFSAISAISTLLAIKVSSLLIKEDENYPFGFSGYESLYVLFRSTLLLITVLLALLDSVGKIVAFATTKTVPSVNASVFVAYVVFIALMYVVLNFHYGKYIKVSNGDSDLLVAEKFNAKSNSYLMVGVAGSFLLIGLLKFTPLSFLVPISDAIIVLVIAILVILDTTKLFVNTLKTLGGKGIVSEEKTTLELTVSESIKDLGIIRNLKIQRIGKTAYVVVNLMLHEKNVASDDISKVKSSIENIISELYSVNYTFVTYN